MNAPAAPVAAVAAAARLDDIESFYAMEIMREATQLERAGRSIIYLCVGEPDFSAPAAVMDAAIAAMRRGDTHYTVALGIAPLREAIAGFYATRYGITLSPERVAVTAGASGAMLILFGSLVDPGDEWLMPDPTYPCNRRFISLFGGSTRLIPCGAAQNYQLTPELVARHWGPRTRGVMLASPSNPTGTTVPAAAMRGIYQVVRERGGALVVDEIYHGLTYGRDAAGRFVEEPTALGLGDDVFVINSFSKYFSMTGWRLGWVVAPQSHMKNLEKLAQNLFICPPTLSQHAALACFEPDTIAIFEQRRHAFQARRDYLLPALRALGFRIEVEPEGAFYLYCDVSDFTDDAQAFCAHFLETEHVAFTPGLDFGHYRANQHVRLAYTQEIPRLEDAVARIARGLDTWKRTDQRSAPTAR
jgi:aspartate/methionine/tyrosine aminotransferase